MPNVILRVIDSTHVGVTSDVVTSAGQYEIVFGVAPTSINVGTYVPEYTGNVWDFERDFGAPTDGVTSAAAALQNAVNTIFAAGGGMLRTRSRVYVIDRPIVVPFVSLSTAAPTLEILGPFAFSIVPFAPGYPTSWDVPAIAKGTIFKSTVAPMAAPVQANPSTATTGGALAAATYYYVITATYLGLEGVYSNEKSQVTTGAASTVTLNWAVAGYADGYKIYRGTAPGAENKLVATISGGSTVSYTDVGGATTAVSPPGNNNIGASAIVTTPIQPYTNVLFKLKNVILRCPMNPQAHGIDAGYMSNLELENVKVDTGGSTGDTLNPIVQPTAGTTGIIFPAQGNGGHVVARNVTVEGFGIGASHSEHCLLDNFTAFKNGVGLRIVDGWHAARHGRVSLYWNTIGVQSFLQVGGDPITRLWIDQLDYEETNSPTAWFRTTAHIDDPSNRLRGSIAYHRVISGTGIVAWLRRNGAAFLELKFLGATEKTIFDIIGFDGTASASAIGSSLGSIPAQSFLGTWGKRGVSSTPNYQAYISSLNAGNNLVGWDSGQAQVQLHCPITMSPTAGGHFNSGLLINYVDASNFMCVAISPTTVSIQKMDAGAQTSPAGPGNSVARTTAPGEVLDLVVQQRGGWIQVHINDVLVAYYQMTSAERTKYMGGYIHGFYAYAPGNEDGGTSWGFLRMAMPGPFSPA